MSDEIIESKSGIAMENITAKIAAHSSELRYHSRTLEEITASQRQFTEQTIRKFDELTDRMDKRDQELYRVISNQHQKVMEAIEQKTSTNWPNIWSGLAVLIAFVALIASPLAAFAGLTWNTMDSHINQLGHPGTTQSIIELKERSSINTRNFNDMNSRISYIEGKMDSSKKFLE